MKQKENKIGMIIFILFVLILTIFNVRLEVYEKEKTKVININGFEDINVNRDFNEVYCDVPSKSCYWMFEDDCHETDTIYHHWKSNVVGDWKAKYLSFKGYGTCTIKYPTKRLRLVWM